MSQAGMNLDMHQRQDKQKELDPMIGQSNDKLQMHRVVHGLLTPSGRSLLSHPLHCIISADKAALYTV